MNTQQALVVNSAEQGLSELTQVPSRARVLFRSDGYTVNVTKRRAEFLLNTVPGGTPYTVQSIDRLLSLVIIDGGN